MAAMIRRDKRWTEIKLPSKPRRKFPREMLVSMTGKDGDWIKKTVFGKIKSNLYPFMTKDSSQPEYRFDGWKCAKEIE